MNSSDCEPSLTATVDLEEPPGSSTYTSSSSYDLPVYSPPEPRRQAAPPVVAQGSIVETVPAGATRRSRANTRTRAFRRAFFRDVPDKDWNDWRWQSRHRIRKLDQIERMLVLSNDEREALIKGEKGPFCFGDKPTIADLCLVPQLANARRFGVDVSGFPRLLEAEAAAKEMNAFADAAPDRQSDAE